MSYLMLVFGLIIAAIMLFIGYRLVREHRELEGGILSVCAPLVVILGSLAGGQFYKDFPLRRDAVGTILLDPDLAQIVAPAAVFAAAVACYLLGSAWRRDQVRKRKVPNA
jgi:hypothetical protein